MNSKIIQISTTTVNATPYVYALCEDGSIWRKSGNTEDWALVSDAFKKKGARLEMVKNNK